MFLTRMSNKRKLNLTLTWQTISMTTMTSQMTRQLNKLKIKAKKDLLTIMSTRQRNQSLSKKNQLTNTHGAHGQIFSRGYRIKSIEVTIENGKYFIMKSNNFLISWTQKRMIFSCNSRYNRMHKLWLIWEISWLAKKPVCLYTSKSVHCLLT